MSEEKAKTPTPEEVRHEGLVNSLLKPKKEGEAPRAKSRAHAEFLIKSGSV